MVENSSQFRLKGLSGRLILIFSAVIVGVIGFSMYVALVSRATRIDAEVLAEKLRPVSETGEQILVDVQELRLLVRDAIDKRTTFDFSGYTVSDDLARLTELLAYNPEAKAAADSLGQMGTALEQSLTGLNAWLNSNYVAVSDDSLFLATLPDREANELPSLSSAVSENLGNIESQIRDIHAHNKSEEAEWLQRMESRSDLAFQLSAIGGVFVVISIIFGAYAYLRSFRKSLEGPTLILDKMVRGETVNGVVESKDELGQIMMAAKKLSANLQQASTFAQRIGEGDVNHHFQPVSDADLLGNSLVQMRDKLKNINDSDRKRNWVTEGLALFADILRKHDDYTMLANTVISELVKYTGSTQGGIFTIQEEGDQKSLQLDACYAYERRKYLQKKVELGEGLVGQCYLEARTILLKKVPQDYVLITSGLGGANPSALLLVPMKVNDMVEGVLELASFKPYEPHEIEFVEKLGEIIASSISTAKTNEQTKRLLEETQQHAEEMRAQEEEMRQNMEEMQATQEQLQRQTDEMHRMQQKLEIEQSMFQVLMEYLPDRVTFKDKESKVLRINRAKAVRFNIQPEEMIGKTDYDYFSKEHADKAFAEEQALIRSGTPMINIEERALLNNGDIVWASTSRIPFKNDRNEIVGMFIITKDVTKQKVAEASIQDRERIIEHLLDSMPVFRYRIDKDGTVSQLWKSKALKKFDQQMFEYKHVKDCMPEVYDLLDQKDLQDVDLIGKGVINVGGEMEIFKHYLFKDSSYDHVYYGFAIKQ